MWKNSWDWSQIPHKVARRFRSSHENEITSNGNKTDL